MTSGYYQSSFNWAKSLNELRQTNTGCDVILQVGSRAFMAHKMVLIARLEYFRSMFTLDMRDKEKLFVTLDPTIIDPDIFEELLECVYTSELKFTAKNFTSICKAADFLCFEELLENAQKYVRSSMKIDTSNHLFRALISGVGCESLQEKCHRMLLENPSCEIARKLLIPTLTLENLRAFLKEMSHPSSEKDMFYYSVEWVEQDIENRADKLFELMRKVPWRRLPREFIQEVVCKNSLVSGDSKCLKMLVKILAEDKPKETVYVLGGADNKIIHRSVSKFDLINKKWQLTGTELPEEVYDFGIAVVGQRIFVCGGESSNEKASNKLFVYNCSNNNWKTLRPMKYSRSGCAMAYLNGYLYVAGGYKDEDEKYNQVERYSIEKNQWQDVASMAHKRSGLQLVQMKGYIYAIGGTDTLKGNYLQTAELYDPETDEWQPIKSMNEIYAYFGAAVLEDFIFIVGPYSFEKYDSEANKWTVLPAPSECSYGRRLAALDGKLYLFGGALEVDKVSSSLVGVEYFDFVRNAWFDAKDMDIARTCHGVAVVKSD